MLKLKNIKKDYIMGDTAVRALRGIDITFRENEFVSILGPSGCGKTTLLNIIGGLDQYTSGDLIIGGRSTKEFSDRDWDTYRNHSIGFVFQSYNLIPHQTVLANVELALTISGVSKAERRRRAVSVLEKVGLADQLNKRPGQLSGGQMQRVAIARALVNDPDILLADEPTGALDSETSIQVMDLLRDVAADKLVIMVTHNPELAERYSTRIIRLLDGRITDDTDPCDNSAEQPKADVGKKKPSMSFLTALSLSLNNLMTKKTRTVLTSFAGSIGIIGIALIMALSNGIQMYIDRVQEDTLSSYPINIEADAVDLTTLITTMSGAKEASEKNAHPCDAVYSNVIMYDLMDSLTSMDTKTNDLESFKAWLESPECPLTQYASTIQYSYDAAFDIYTMAADGRIVKTDVVELLEKLMGAMYGGDYTSYFDTMGDMYSQYNVWEEMLGGENGELISDTLKGQYDVIYGDWPSSHDEVVLFVNQNNEVSDLVLYALGLTTDSDLTKSLNAGLNLEQVNASQQKWSYEDICSRSFKLLTPGEYYEWDSGKNCYRDMTETDEGLARLFADSGAGIKLSICGIVRQNADAVSGMVSGAIGYTSALENMVIDKAAGTDIVKAQLADPEHDVLTALPFTDAGEEISDEEVRSAVELYAAPLTTAERAGLYVTAMSAAPDEYVYPITDAALEKMSRGDIESKIAEAYSAHSGTDAETVLENISGLSDKMLFSYVREVVAEQMRKDYSERIRSTLAPVSQEKMSQLLTDGSLSDFQYRYLYDNCLPTADVTATFKSNLAKFGYVDTDSPSSVKIYATSFKDKDAIASAIDAYNEGKDDDHQIKYTDYVALLMSSITTIINAISYVLIAFVAISLVVSSIMIGIITYISVLERKKEIGVLRSIGASKRDVGNVFNAETLIEGFTSGVFGIVVTLLLLIPINIIIHYYTNLPGLNAVLPVFGAVGLVLISMLLTFTAGLIPSGIAARRDPVEALRTE